MHCIVVTAQDANYSPRLSPANYATISSFRVDANIVVWLDSTDALFVPGSTTPSPWAIVSTVPV